MISSAVLIANCVNPLLTAFLVAAPFIGVRKSSCWEFWGRTALALGLAVVLAESGKHFQVWPGHPSFPSGHETFGLCAAASLALRNVRWLILSLPLVLLLAWALVDAHFHQPIDVAGALLVGPPCAALFQRLRKPRLI